jgi:flagellar basal body-associated protein FliL
MLARIILQRRTMKKETMETKETQTKNSSRLRIIIIVGFVIAAILTAYLTFSVVQNFVKTWEITSLPGLPVLKSQVTSTPNEEGIIEDSNTPCLLYTSPSPRDRQKSRMPSSA